MVARGGGSLICTSAFVGTSVGFPGMGAYAAGKAGVIGLVKVIAAEYGPQGVRANAVLPGGTDTPMGRVVLTSPEMRTRSEEHTSELQSLMRISYAVFCLKKKIRARPTQHHKN